jgi:hypothetical protein
MAVSLGFYSQSEKEKEAEKNNRQLYCLCRFCKYVPVEDAKANWQSIEATPYELKSSAEIAGQTQRRSESKQKK